MTLELKLDLDMVKMYHSAKMKFLGQCIQKLQTHYENITFPHMQAVIKIVVIPEFNYLSTKLKKMGLRLDCVYSSTWIIFIQQTCRKWLT